MAVPCSLPANGYRCDGSPPGLAHILARAAALTEIAHTPSRMITVGVDGNVSREIRSVRSARRSISKS